ncbi:NUDIX domain-containing protein [Paenibacillus sp. sgz500958]|uniref:NUDIX hydrolase n=1 Tax=Paenibacillus sp. sgz500958 TaxID=3242475 RepID=UPI0036D3CA46
MTPIEMLDVFDEQMGWTGTDSRDNVHRKGLWHQTFHCWVIHPWEGEGGSLLFQLRHPDKETYPGLLDISCAGHLQAGEAVRDGVRELKEELGLDVPFEELIFCGMNAEEVVLSDTYIDREFNHVFIYKTDKPLSEYHFQRTEISGLYLVKIKDYRDLLNGDIESVWVEGIASDESGQVVRPDQRRIQRDDFTPNSDDYYRILFDFLEKEQLL